MEEHMNIFLLLWALTGGGLSVAVMMHFWLPDPPPPNVFNRFISVVVAGAVGGLVGGYLVHGGLAASDPMPGIVAAAGGGLILSGIAAALGARGGANR
jgi:hypothetical protein